MIPNLFDAPSTIILKLSKHIAKVMDFRLARTVRDIIQAKLMGPPGAPGAGLIPGGAILRTTTKSGVAGAVDTAGIRHVSGGSSLLAFRSFDQGREAFQGTEQDVVWLDEEPPLPVYTECLMRTMTTDGLVMLTFTPLLGMSEVVLAFLEGAESNSVRKDRGGDC